MQALRLDCENHAVFQHGFAAFAQHRFLLMEPGAHAVPNQRRRIFDAVLSEFIDHELVDISRRAARGAALDRAAVDIQR